MTRRGPLVVIGDTLLDIDLNGVSERLSPDAPVPVVQEVAEHARAGGAGLAATLAAALSDSRITLVTGLAGDEHAARLRDLLPVDEVRLLPMATRGETVRKVRVRSSGHPVVRLDFGDARTEPCAVGPEVAEALRGAGAILVADYGHGTAANPDVRRLLSTLTRHVPVVWDPHPAGPPPVPGTRLATPNSAEARTLAGRTVADPEPRRLQRPAGRFEAAAADAAVLMAAWRAAGVSVTLGEHGALLSVGDDVVDLVPAPQTHMAADPCGAGDCFAAAAALALGDGSLLAEAVAEGVRRASAFVEAGGIPDPEPLGKTAWEVVEQTRARGGTVVATGGCFDLLHAGHVELLRQARSLGDCLVVCLNSDTSVREIKGPGRPLVGQTDRMRVLTALDSVDAVMVFDERTPVELIDRIRPDLWVKGGDYASAEMPETSAVRRHGGEVVLLPYLEGRSTTRLVERAMAGGLREEP